MRSTLWLTRIMEMYLFVVVRACHRFLSGRLASCLQGLEYLHREAQMHCAPWPQPVGMRLTPFTVELAEDIKEPNLMIRYDDDFTKPEVVLIGVTWHVVQGIPTAFVVGHNEADHGGRQALDFQKKTPSDANKYWYCTLLALIFAAFVFFWLDLTADDPMADFGLAQNISVKVMGLSGTPGTVQYSVPPPGPSTSPHCRVPWRAAFLAWDSCENHRKSFWNSSTMVFPSRLHSTWDMA